MGLGEGGVSGELGEKGWEEALATRTRVRKKRVSSEGSRVGDGS